MKRVSIFAVSIFASSLTFAATSSEVPAQNADNDLCDRNLEQISNYRATDKTTMGEPNKSRVQELRSQAEEFRRDGDIRNCISVSEQALTILKQTNSK